MIIQFQLNSKNPASVKSESKYNISVTEMYLKVSATWRPSCWGFIVLTNCVKQHTETHFAQPKWITLTKKVKQHQKLQLNLNAERT